MENPVEHRRLTFVALRIAGEVFAVLAVPIGVLTKIAHMIENRLTSPKPPLIVIAILTSFVISTVTVCIRAIKYNQLYLQPPPEERPKDEVPDDKKAHLSGNEDRTVDAGRGLG
jgi:hypothetical protein